MRRERFSVIAPQGLGDTLEATPFLKRLRTARPDAFISAIVLREAARDLVAQVHLVDEILYLPYWDRGLVAFLIAALRIPLQRRFDAAFLMYPAARPVYLGLAALVPARRRYAHAYDRSVLRRMAGFAIEQIPVALHHNVKRNTDLLRAAGIAGEDPARYVVPEAWLKGGVRDDNRIIIHVGTIVHAGLEARRWPESCFAELGRRLEGRGFRITFLAGPAELEVTERVAAAVPPSELLSLPLVQAAQTIAACRAVIANDNGIAHVAAGCGTPVLALFGPTPVEHGPYGTGSVAFRPSPCPACFDVVKTDSRCKRNIDYACLKADLSVDLVEQRFLELLAETGASSYSSVPASAGDGNGKLG